MDLQDPPQPPTTTPPHQLQGDDEVDVDLDDDDDHCPFGEIHEPPDVETDDDDLCADDPRATIPEGVEYLGAGYTSLADYFRRELEDLVDSSITWLLDCVDWRAVQARMEGKRYRYLIECGQVFRIASDPAGPWMPTRG